MKLKITPTREKVREVLVKRRDREVAQRTERQKELTELATAKIIRPGQDVALKHLIRQQDDYIQGLEFQLSLIDDSETPRCLVEIDL